MLQLSTLLSKQWTFNSSRNGYNAVLASAVALFVSHQQCNKDGNFPIVMKDTEQLILCCNGFMCINSKICACESINAKQLPLASSSPSVAPKASRFKIFLYNFKLLPYSFLSEPRLLTPNDPVFDYPEFKRGLRQRKKDEICLNELLSSEELKHARATQNQEKLHSILDQMHTILYGKDVTPQLREEFLIQNGCTGYSSSILEYLVELGKNRGFIEIGAGNGQWAQALTDCHDGYCERNSKLSLVNASKTFEFVQAWDNMEALPLSPEIYHPKTIPAHRYFYPNVKKCESHTDVVQGYASRGRILLLVFPPPSPMAIETVKAFVHTHKENDTVVYVGEGKGGANCSNEFFDYFLGKGDFSDSQEKWILLKVMAVKPCPGGKGYEKMFVFQRVR